MHRVENIINQTSRASNDWRNSAAMQKKPLRASQPSDVVICCAVRTPITKAKKGGLAKAFPEDLLKPLFQAILSRTRLDPIEIQDVCIGNVLQPGSGALSSRIAQLLAGLPESIPIHTVNRQCSSGLQAVANIAGQIHAGYINIGLAGGVESMTHFDMMAPENMSDQVFAHHIARNCLLPMGITSENVAEKFGISRVTQDELALASHTKASSAQRNGFFDDEIIPVRINGKTISKDDGIRPDTNIDDLGKLKPAFKEGGSTTAGNSSQISDGAALCLLARRSTADRLGLPIIARFVAFFVVGVSPHLMGIGPAIAVPSVLRQAGLSMDDIDIFEINEAFGSQAAYCAEYLKIPKHKLNPKGGAIALGHPLGATGCRQIATLLPELRRTNTRYGVVSMCMGTGMGAAAIIENLQ